MLVTHRCYLLKIIMCDIKKYFVNVEPVMYTIKTTSMMYDIKIMVFYPVRGSEDMSVMHVWVLQIVLMLPTEESYV